MSNTHKVLVATEGSITRLDEKLLAEQHLVCLQHNGCWLLRVSNNPQELRRSVAAGFSLNIAMLIFAARSTNCSYIYLDVDIVAEEVDASEGFSLRVESMAIPVSLLPLRRRQKGQGRGGC